MDGGPWALGSAADEPAPVPVPVAAVRRGTPPADEASDEEVVESVAEAEASVPQQPQGEAGRVW